ncbi:MAG: hypothetical protein QME96_11740 [Myxococcota bacterium]|nr:hypothetical protein [Myxococcota bacterium]
MKAPELSEWRDRFRAAGYRIDRDLVAGGAPVGFVATWDLPFSLRPFVVAVGVGVSAVEEVERFGGALEAAGTAHVRLFASPKPGLVRRPCAERSIHPIGSIGHDHAARVAVAVPDVADLRKSPAAARLVLPLLPDPVPLKVVSAGPRGLDAERVSAIRASMREQGAPRAICFVESVDPQIERLASAGGIDLIPGAFPAAIPYRLHEVIRKSFLHAFGTWPCAGCPGGEPCSIEVELGEVEARLRRGFEQVVYVPAEVRIEDVPSLDMRYGHPLAIVAPRLPPGVAGHAVSDDSTRGGGELLRAVVDRFRRRVDEVLAAAGPQHDGALRGALVSCGAYHDATGAAADGGVLLLPRHSPIRPSWLRIRGRTQRYYVVSEEPAGPGDEALPGAGTFRRTVRTGRDATHEMLALFPDGGASIRFRLSREPSGEMRAYLREAVGGGEM